MADRGASARRQRPNVYHRGVESPVPPDASPWVNGFGLPTFLDSAHQCRATTSFSAEGRSGRQSEVQRSGVESTMVRPATLLCMSRAYLLVLGEREAISWVLREERMAFPATPRSELSALE